MGIELFPGIDKPTSRDRLGIELADEQLNMILWVASRTARKRNVDH